MRIQEETPDFGRWSERGLPHKGWTWQNVEDLDEMMGRCDMCNRQIRYVHYITHDDVDEVMGVGCVCATHLTEDYVNPERREVSLRSRTIKLQTLMSKEWTVSPKGYTLKTRGYRCTVFQRTGGRYAGWWKYVIGPAKFGDGDSYFSDEIYKHLRGAKVACFTKLIELKEAERA